MENEMRMNKFKRKKISKENTAINTRKKKKKNLQLKTKDCS